MTNVKPGDLAMVTHGRHKGATCIVGADVSSFWMLGRVMWECEFPRPMQWDFPPGWSCIGDVPDRYLRRITGPDVSIDVPTEQGVTA